MKFAFGLVGVLTSAMIGHSFAQQENPSDPYIGERPSDPKTFIPVSLICPPSRDGGILERLFKNQIGGSQRVRVVYYNFVPVSVEIALAQPGEEFKVWRLFTTEETNPGFKQIFSAHSNS